MSQCSWRERISLLELLHPDGSANTSFVLGSNCPEKLLPESSPHAEQNIGLIILAPTGGEYRVEGWLESATRFVQQRLSDDGVCYLLVPPGWRGKTIRLLTRASLVRDLSFWHFPNWTSSHYLVPLQPGPARFAVEEIVPAPPWKKDLAKNLFRYRDIDRLLGAFWNPIGITFRRPNARPLFQWLFQDGELGTAIVRKSWRSASGTEILYSFKGVDAQPSAIVKTTSTTARSASIDHEAKVLEQMGDSVRVSDAQVPQVLRKIQTDQHSSLFLSPIPGRSAADLLASNPELLSPILTKIVNWLETWHVTTKQVRTTHAGQLEQAILIPINQLAPSLQNLERYRDWLLQRVQAVSQTPIPFVTAHNDLTMANVLVSDQIGIVDWETGMPEGWPLVDFYYAVTDAVRIVQGSTTWLQAFQACYQSEGDCAHDIRRWEQQLQAAVGISATFSELCFHACWLNHASNEQKVTRPGQARPFLQIVQWLAMNYAPSTGNRNLENVKETDPEKNNSNWGRAAVSSDSQRVAADSKCPSR